MRDLPNRYKCCAAHIQPLKSRTWNQCYRNLRLDYGRQAIALPIR